MSDVPLGAMLSGGLDSSLIVALMAQHMGEPRRHVRRRLRRRGLRAARRPPRRGRARRSTTTSSSSRSAPITEDLTDLIWHLDEPLADLSSLGFLPLSRLAAEHVTVALSGQGADELFGGYRKHRVASLVERWDRVPGPLRAGAAAALQPRPRPRRPAGRGARVRRHRGARHRHSGLVRPELRAAIFGGALAEHAGAAESVLRGRMAGAPGAAPLEAALYLDARLGLVDDMLTYFDRASMACSLEVRVPFLDHELVELAARIPTHHKVRRLQGKHVLRLAARGRVPDFVLKKRKRGFFNEAVGDLARRRRRRTRRPAAALARPRLRRGGRPARGRARPCAEWRGGRARAREPAARAGDARAVARPTTCRGRWRPAPVRAAA